MTMIPRPVLAILMALAMLLVAPLARADGKIAVIDLRRAVTQTEEGMRAQANIKKLFESRQQELNKRQNELVKQREELEKQAKVLSKEALGKRQEEWQKAMMELQQVFLSYNQELEKKERDLTAPIAEKIQGIVKRIATADGYDLVVDRTAVPFVRDHLDLTDRCIQEYNKTGGK